MVLLKTAQRSKFEAVIRRHKKCWYYPWTASTNHHSVPAISRLITAQQCDSIDTIEQNNILAVADTIGELHFIA